MSSNFAIIAYSPGDSPFQVLFLHLPTSFTVYLHNYNCVFLFHATKPYKGINLFRSTLYKLDATEEHQCEATWSDKISFITHVQVLIMRYEFSRCCSLPIKAATYMHKISFYLNQLLLKSHVENTHGGNQQKFFLSFKMVFITKVHWDSTVSFKHHHRWWWGMQVGKQRCALNKIYQVK